MDKTLKIGRTVHYCEDVEKDCVPAVIQKVLDVEQGMVEVVWQRNWVVQLDKDLYRDESSPRFVEVGHGSAGWHWFDECPKGL